MARSGQSISDASGRLKLPGKTVVTPYAGIQLVGGIGRGSIIPLAGDWRSGPHRQTEDDDARPGQITRLSRASSVFQNTGGCILAVNEEDRRLAIRSLEPLHLDFERAFLLLMGRIFFLGGLRPMLCRGLRTWSNISFSSRLNAASTVLECRSRRATRLTYDASK
jgi:hypothetical protein